MKRMKLLFTLALPVFLSQNVLAQTSSRLIAEAHWSNDGAAFKPVDSSNYSYLSSARGGDLTHPLMFDWGYAFTFLGDTAYMNEWRTQKIYDANNNDSVNIVSSWNGTTWTPYSSTLNFYLGTTKQSTVYQTWSGSWQTQFRDVYSYYSGGLLFQDLYQSWNGVAYVTNSEKLYYYNTSNLLINEQDIDLSTGSPVNSAQYNYTYSSTNQLLTKTYQTWNGSSWVNNNMYTNTYDTTGRMVNQEYQVWDATNSVWSNTSLAEYSNFYGTTGLPQTVINEAWSPVGTGTWVPSKKYTNAYNSFNQLTYSVGISYNNSISSYQFAAGDPLSNYYYQSYSFVNAVNNVSAVNGDANIYPVPTKDELHIDINWTVAQTATINIFDVQGRVVRQIETGLSTSTKVGIPVSDFAPGVYMIKIVGQLGQIEKQIVVAH